MDGAPWVVIKGQELVNRQLSITVKLFEDELDARRFASDLTCSSTLGEGVQRLLGVYQCRVQSKSSSLN